MNSALCLRYVLLYLIGVSKWGEERKGATMNEYFSETATRVGSRLQCKRYYYYLPMEIT